jgi:hypothetical protein
MGNAALARSEQVERQVDPLEETQQNPELPRLLAIRASRGLSHLTLDSRPVTEADSARGAARAALLYALVLFALGTVVVVRLLALPHAGS